MDQGLAMSGDGYAVHGMFKDFDYREKNGQ